MFLLTLDSTDHSNSKLIFRVFGRLVYQTCLCTLRTSQNKDFFNFLLFSSQFVCLFILEVNNDLLPFLILQTVGQKIIIYILILQTVGQKSINVSFTNGSKRRLAAFIPA
jgi:hypothetical protein